MRLGQPMGAQVPREDAESPLAYALAYARIGWHVFPVHWIEGGRCSCAQNCDSPGKHPIWQVTPTGFKVATTDAAIIRRWWSQYPRANVAVRTGSESGIWVLDVDVGGEKRGDVALEQLIDTHGQLPDSAVSHTGSGGRHYFFAYPADGSRIGNRTNMPAPGIDVRGDGGYVVVPPSIHISGGTYEWEASSDPIEGQTIAGDPGWHIQAVTEPARSKEPASTVEAGATLLTREQVLELKSALGYLDFEDYHRWIQVGQALHASGAGQQAYGLWCDWSRQSEKFNPEMQAKKWRSFGTGRGLNLESIFAWAQAAGWVNPASNEYQEWLESTKNLIEKANRRVEYRTVEPEVVPVRRLPVPALEQAGEWLARQLPVYHAHAVTQATLSFACAMAARRYISSEGDPAHTYLGIVCRSIGAVREIKSLLQRLMAESGQRRMIRGTKVSTPHILYKTLLRAPAVHWVVDDYGQMVAFARRQSSGHIEGALSALADCYASRALYLDQDVDPVALKHYDDCTVYDPALSLLGLISDDQLGVLTKRSEIGRGALEQMLCVHAGEAQVNPTPELALAVPEAVKAAVAALRESRHEGNLADVFPGTLPADPQIVAFPTEVKLRLSDFDRALTDLVGTQRHLLPLAMGGRQTMRRLLVTFAAWHAPAAPRADVVLADWAGTYVRDHLAAFIERVQMASEDGKPDAYERALEVLQEAGPEGLTRRLLARRCRAFRALKQDQREELVSRMLDDEMIVEMRQGKSTVMIDHRFVREMEK